MAWRSIEVDRSGNRRIFSRATYFIRELVEFALDSPTVSASVLSEIYGCNYFVGKFDGALAGTKGYQATKGGSLVRSSGAALAWALFISRSALVWSLSEVSFNPSWR